MYNIYKRKESISSIRKVFITRSGVKEKYTEFMREYKLLQHIKLDIKEEKLIKKEMCYFIPHHIIFNSTSQTS